MPSITVNDFKIGKDSRKGASVSDADRLIECKNAYINAGKVPRKRPGSGSKVALETGSDGLLSANDKLNTFFGKGILTHADPLFVANLLNSTVDHPVYVGAGLDDMSTSGEYSDVSSFLFEVEIDATGSPDTFKWRKDGGSYTTGINITGSAQPLSDGVNITFAATTGHTLADVWSFNGNFYNNVKTIHFADVFLGFIYVAVEYDTGLTRHHYLNGALNTQVKDPNCPNTTGVLKIIDKIFAVDGDTVAFSTTGDPLDWTTAADAGFLATGQQQANADNALSLGQFGKSGLIVLHEDGAQLWTVDPDPALHVYEKSLDGFASRYPRTVMQFAGDLFMLGDGGVRSAGEHVFSTNIQEQDVGSPIDRDIKAILTENSVAFSARFSALSQFWLIIDGFVFVYTFSRTQKISAWSEYFYPWTIDYLEEFRGQLYIREGDNVYKVDEDLFQDDGIGFEAEVQTAFLTAKLPGVNKGWWGIDVIAAGEARTTFKYDPNKALAETSEIILDGDTTPDQPAPVEVVSPSLSVVFKNNKNEEFQLDSFTLYYNELTVT